MARAQKTPQQRLRETKAYLDSLDFAGLASGGGNPDDLRRIGDAVLRSVEDEQQLYEAVAAARATGHTWNQIAAVLGVSRQAATEKFGQEADRG